MLVYQFHIRTSEDAVEIYTCDNYLVILLLPYYTLNTFEIEESYQHHQNDFLTLYDGASHEYKS